jgi:hypothetical protein
MASWRVVAPRPAPPHSGIPTCDVWPAA